MPLNWSVKRVQDWERVTTAPWSRDSEEKEWHPVTQCLVWYSLSCGWSEITEKNAEEIATRIRIESEVLGSYYKTANGEPCIPTLADVRMHIGMTTNAPRKTRAQWLRGLWSAAAEATIDISESNQSMFDWFEQREQDRRGLSNIGSVAA